MSWRSQSPAGAAESGAAADAIRLALADPGTTRTPAGFRILDVHPAGGPATCRLGEAAPVGLAAGSFTLAPAGTPRRLSVQGQGRFLRARLAPAALPGLAPDMLAGLVTGRDGAVSDAARAVADRLSRGEAAPPGSAGVLVDALGQALGRGPGPDLCVVAGTDCVARALDIIERHLEDPLTLGAIADLTGTPQLRLMRRFRLATGVSVREFVLRRRLARAESLLQGGAASIADVAYAVGFGSQSLMTTHFRRRLGRTPGEIARR